MAPRKKKLIDAVLMEEDSSYAQALQKAEDPNMTTANNPLAEDHAQVLWDQVVDANMSKLHQDACLRRNPRTGGVYASIMDNRYNGG